MSESLARLARTHGIALDYDDIWGHRHHVAAATQRVLLEAMNVAAAHDDDVARSLDAHERQRWREPLAPLVVVRADARPWTLLAHLPQRCAQVSLEFHIVCEDGTTLPAVAPGQAQGGGEHASYDGETWIVRALGLDVDLPIGYHALSVVAGNEVLARTILAVAPASCYNPLADPPGKAWGTAVQLYAVRSARNWGMGDFTDLAGIVELWGTRGAGVIGMNPLHALFPHDPQRASPYSPSSRLFRNILYLDVEAVTDFRECEAARDRVCAAHFQAELSRVRDEPLVDHAGVAALKLPVLEMLYAHFRSAHLERATARGEAFRAFVRMGGEALRRHALFEALQAHFFAGDASIWGWPVWPPAYRQPEAPEVERFAAGHGDRVEFFMYLQWQADLQLAAVAARASDIGLRIGLYTDLAVSIDRGGAEAWAHQDLYAVAASVGAPPDAFNKKGQDWGLPPLVPERLRAAAYAPFIATLRANMRHAGALRIDHVMGLQRLYWVPAGRSAAEGAYVCYPLDDLLGLLALESHRNHCLVIGEDLGTVPDSIREALRRSGVLSYRVLFFEREQSGDFKPPSAYPSQALVSVSTHDLPTLAGWWHGEDIHVRSDQGLFPRPEDHGEELSRRAADRGRLVAALAAAGTWPAEGAGGDASLSPDMTPRLSCAVHAFLGASEAALLVVQPEDVLGERAQANLPGTTDSYPNWRRKLTLTLERWAEDERFVDLASVLVRARGSSRRSAPARTRIVPRVVPRATYRVQLHREFTFADAAALVPYLAALGVSHVYCSPYLRARPGSTHGYDIVDHGMLNPEIGSRADFEHFVDTLSRHGMGHICDVVPNHMGVMGADNAWWMDVLEHGPASAYAEYFDIDWQPLDPDLAGKVLLPVLGTPYGAVLASGDIDVVFEPDTGSFVVRYFEHRFPLDPSDYPRILDRAVEALGDPADIDAAGALVEAFAALASRQDDEPERRATRRRESVLLKSRLQTLAATRPAVAEAIGRALETLRGTPGKADTYEALHALLETQAFRLASWRVASDEINYRRFFDINDLAALRMENAAVFDVTHALVIALAAAGRIDGLRIDHPDGLFDPARYFERLQSRYREARIRSGLAGEGAAAARDGGLYVLLEKIAAGHERYPETWPVAGSTGYRFANVVNGLFVDARAKDRVDRAWRAFVGAEADDFATMAREARRLIMRGSLAAELTMLAHRALRIARAGRVTRDFTFNLLREAIAEIVARFPVYRTYVAATGATAQDRRYIEWAVSQARRGSRAADPSVFDFLQDLMVAAAPKDAPPATLAERRAFAMRFQQFTSPVAAKGVEDTSFYRFNRLMSLNDVGGDPDQFGTTVRAFHGASLDRCATWPATMLATSTHDNKRSEDVRARIDVISERPAEWRLAVRRWSRMNRSRKRIVDDSPAPSRNDEYLLYQTLVGSFPTGPLDAAALEAYRQRIEAYMLKAAREAKVHTSWLRSNADYEDALAAFVRALLAAGPNLFLDDLRAQCATYAWFGMLNSLSMTLLKLTSPGVPDHYQGNEIFDLSLVDPDNRRPVDYAARRSLLAALECLAAGPAESLATRVRTLFDAPYDGRTKLWTILRLLSLRRQHQALFRDGDYVPLQVDGARAEHVVAFSRRLAQEGIVVVAGRLFAQLGLAVDTLPLGEEAWGGTTLAAGVVPQGARLVDALTGTTFAREDGPLPLAALFTSFPGAVLHYRVGA